MTLLNSGVSESHSYKQAQAVSKRRVNFSTWKDSHRRACMDLPVLLWVSIQQHIQVFTLQQDPQLALWIKGHVPGGKRKSESLGRVQTALRPRIHHEELNWGQSKQRDMIKPLLTSDLWYYCCHRDSPRIQLEGWSLQKSD